MTAIVRDDVVRHDAARRKRGHVIKDVIRWMKLIPLVGTPGGVRLKYREPSGKSLAAHNDTAGTLLEIRRTRGSVDFNGEEWNIPLDQLIPADEADRMQRFRVPLGASR